MAITVTVVDQNIIFYDGVNTLSKDRNDVYCTVSSDDSTVVEIWETRPDESSRNIILGAVYSNWTPTGSTASAVCVAINELLNTSSAATITVTTTVTDGTYGDIVVSSSGLTWTLLASINKAITGIWSFVSDKLWLYNAAQTFYTKFISLASANRTVTYPDKDMTVAGTNDKLSAFASTTSSELASVISDPTGGGSLVFGTTPTLRLPSIVDTTDTTKKLKFLLSGATTGKNLTLSSSHTDNRTMTVPDRSFTIAGTDDKLSAFAATTSAELAGVISDETGSGALVFATSPDLAGTPTAPTAAAGTDTTQIATTAFVLDENYFNVRVVGANAQSPADATTYYMGGAVGALSTTEGARKILIPYACTLIGATICAINTATACTSETSTFYFRKNATTDTTLFSTVAFNGAVPVAKNYTVTGLSVAMNGTTDYFEVKWTTPTWATNPTGAVPDLILIFKRT